MYTPPTNKKPVHLVKNFDEVPANKRFTQPLYAQTKYDGVFAYGLLVDGDNRIFSRTGEQCFSLKHIEDDLASVTDKQHPRVLIFEVFVPRWPVNKISGSFRRQSEQFTEAIIMVHDCIPYSDFLDGYSALSYGYRHDLAFCVSNRMIWATIIANDRVLRDESEVRAHAESIIKDGGEGGVYKQVFGTWTAGAKNEVMMKIKQGVSYDLEVVGVEEGKGKYEGTTGKLLCKWTEGRVVKCSGMTDQQRHEWWVRPPIGSIVQVDGMCLTPDGMLREPRFKIVRTDKVEADA